MLVGVAVAGMLGTVGTQLDVGVGVGVAVGAGVAVGVPDPLVAGWPLGLLVGTGTIGVMVTHSGVTGAVWPPLGCVWWGWWVGATLSPMPFGGCVEVFFVDGEWLVWLAVGVLSGATVWLLLWAPPDCAMPKAAPAIATTTTAELVE